MSAIEITPEVLRDIADWLDEGNRGVCTSSDFREEADRLEREQADEQRIDELAQVFYKTRNEAHGWTPDWSAIDELTRESYRDGVRAVIAKLDEEREQPFGRGGPTVQPLRQWGDLRDVPDDVLAVFTPHGKAHRDEDAPNGWRWGDGGNITAVGMTSHAYYVEIPEGTR